MISKKGGNPPLCQRPQTRPSFSATFEQALEQSPTARAWRAFKAYPRPDIRTMGACHLDAQLFGQWIAICFHWQTNSDWRRLKVAFLALKT